jgi:hypothetical protein
MNIINERDLYGEAMSINAMTKRAAGVAVLVI